MDAQAAPWWVQLGSEAALLGNKPWKRHHEGTATDFSAQLRADGLDGEALKTRRLVILLFFYNFI